MTHSRIGIFVVATSGIIAYSTGRESTRDERATSSPWSLPISICAIYLRAIRPRASRASSSPSARSQLFRQSLASVREIRPRGPVSSFPLAIFFHLPHSF